MPEVAADPEEQPVESGAEAVLQLQGDGGQRREAGVGGGLRVRGDHVEVGDVGADE